MNIYAVISPSGKKYIGMTAGSVVVRFGQHMRRGLRSQNRHPLYDAVKKYGRGAFTVETLASGLSVEEAKATEEVLIDLHQTRDRRFGYNVSPGGDYDGATGSLAFWVRISADPEARARYVRKLSAVKRSADWTDYKALGAAAAVWREANPERAAEIVAKASKLGAQRQKEMRAAGWRQAPIKFSTESRQRMSESQRNRWTPELRAAAGAVSKTRTTAVWAGRAREVRAEIGAKISDGVRRMHAAKTPAEKVAADAQLAAARASIDHAKRKANQKAALQAYWTPERRAAFSAKRKAAAEIARLLK